MKKSKVILVILIAVTIISAALAFKTNNRNGTLFCTTVQGGVCSKDSNSNFLKYHECIEGDPLYCTTVAGDCATVLVTLNACPDPR